MKLLEAEIAFVHYVCFSGAPLLVGCEQNVCYYVYSAAVQQTHSIGDLYQGMHQKWWFFLCGILAMAISAYLKL